MTTSSRSSSLSSGAFKRNTPYDFRPNAEYNKLKIKYNLKFLQSIDTDAKKIANFNELVLPCLSCLDERDRRVCLFEDCLDRKLTFSNKQVYVRHLISIHFQDLPAEGSFLTTNSTYYTEHVCANCQTSFKRKDKLMEHLKKSKLCEAKQKSNEASKKQSKLNVFLPTDTSLSTPAASASKNNSTTDDDKQPLGLSSADLHAQHMQQLEDLLKSDNEDNLADLNLLKRESSLPAPTTSSSSSSEAAAAAPTTSAAASASSFLTLSEIELVATSKMPKRELSTYSLASNNSPKKFKQADTSIICLSDDDENVGEQEDEEEVQVVEIEPKRADESNQRMLFIEDDNDDDDDDDYYVDEYDDSILRQNSLMLSTSNALLTPTNSSIISSGISTTNSTTTNIGTQHSKLDDVNNENDIDDLSLLKLFDEFNY